MRSLPSLPRRPFSAYEHGVFTGRDDFRPHIPIKITPFELNPPNMDSVCCKMTESIILSSGSLPKTPEMSEPLCFKSF
jgi:hypothetical protein